jgi:curved DNA-binding protein CbpA
MADYYKILGVEAEASVEEIEARVFELAKRYSFNLKEGGEANERIKEIKEAYEILKNPSTRKEYDFERLLKRSILEKMQQRRKERYDRKKLIIKRLIIPAGAVVLFLVAGLFILKMPQLTIQQKHITPTSAPVPEEKRPTSVSKSVPSEIPEAPDRKPSQTIPEQMAKPQEAISPATKLPEKQLEPNEKIAQEAVKTERPISKEIPRIEEPKPATIEPRPATAHVPVPEKVQKSEIAAAIEVKKPEIIQNKVPREVPKDVLKEAPKEPPKEPLKEVPKEVSRVLPKEGIKTTPREPPASQPRQPMAKPMDQKSQVAQIPSAKPSPPIAAIPPVPYPFVKEDEVREFLAKYVDRYTQRDIEGFLSFFSPLAIQNQKDRIEKIREMYSKQFERYESFNYQLKDPKMKILENSVKVRASYVIEQFSKKGETKQLRGDIEWELVREGKELKVLTIEYKPEKTK